MGMLQQNNIFFSPWCSLFTRLNMLSSLLVLCFLPETDKHLCSSLLLLAVLYQRQESTLQINAIITRTTWKIEFQFNDQKRWKINFRSSQTEQSLLGQQVYSSRASWFCIFSKFYKYTHNIYVKAINECIKQVWSITTPIFSWHIHSHRMVCKGPFKGH